MIQDTTMRAASRAHMSPGTRPVRHAPALAMISMACLAPAAQAMSFAFDNPDLSLNFDNTVKYSNAFRLNNPSPFLLDNPQQSGFNYDDGNRNFRRGLISNRADLFTEADLKYHDVGVRLSGAAWYDTVYNRSNDHDSPVTANQSSVAYNQFTDETRKVAGRKGELLDAFAFGKGTIGSVPVTARLGRHALQWGESVFFGNNAIAGAMAPLDFQKAATVPNLLVREILRPVGQVSGTAELTPAVSVGAYYQYDWQPSRIPAVGSYFSTLDYVGDGAERLLLPTPGGVLSAQRAADLKARDSGQYGLRLKIVDRERGVDYGLYAMRFHAKTPTVLVNGVAIAPGVVLPTDFRFVYPEGIRLFGASVALTSGEYQWSGEVSTRRNTILNGAAPPQTAPGADNNDNPAYPVGNTAHAQVSVLATLSNNFIAKSSVLIAEVAWNRLLSVTNNPQAIFPNTSRDGLAFRVRYAPDYSQVLNGLDISVPVAVGYSPQPRGAALGGFGTTHGGDITAGIEGTYLSVWRFTANYQHFFGPAGLTVGNDGLPTFLQTFKDRDYVSFSVGTTF